MRMPQTADAQQSKPKLLKVNEAAAQLGISREQVYALISRGELASVKIPGRNQAWARRIEQAEIDAFIERNRAQ